MPDIFKFSITKYDYINSKKNKYSISIFISYPTHPEQFPQSLYHLWGSTAHAVPEDYGVHIVISQNIHLIVTKNTKMVQV